METMVAPHRRKLPSADWIAVGLAMLGLMLGRISLPWSGLLGLAVFGPSVLRELGWLRDSDEWQSRIMHRAGFHAAVALALFIFLQRVLPAYDHQYPELQPGPGVWFDSRFLWQTLVMVFLVSYLIQYWGPVQGPVRILLGFSGFFLIDNLVLAVRHGMWQNVLPGLISALVLAGLGLAARRWPRVMGGILLLICLLPMVLWSTTGLPRTDAMVAGVTASMVHMVLIFGVTGAVLLRAGRQEEM
jgi:hypothetical protein